MSQENATEPVRTRVVSENLPSEAIPRRAFVRRSVLGGGLAGVALAGRGAIASERDQEPKPADDPLVAEVDARMALIVARHGTRLDDAARLAIRKDVETMVKRGRTLKAFALTNADEPAPIFHPYRAPLD
jgi:hypothetical protein